GDRRPEVPGPGRVVALVLEVALDEDVAGPQEGGDRGEAGGDGGALLQAQVERVEQVGRGRRPVGDQLALDRRPVDQAGQDRVDRVAPPVAGEVGAGHDEDAGAVVAGVEVRGRLP